MMLLKRKVLINLWISIEIVLGQFTNVELEQGNVVAGIKVFPESSVPVYAFLGIPYAKAPVGDLRFAPPVAHESWNMTVLAHNFKPICPQLDQNPYEQSAESNEGFGNTVNVTQRSEDCLFLNVWAPETGFRTGNLPVVAVITGEELAFDWLKNRPTGLDLAEGLVVVTIQYRTNIFGWLAPPDSGNFGLLDQVEALKWIQKNIVKFGGDPTRTTLLGHGSTGASNAMILLTSPLAEDLFSAAIFMSGTIFSSYSFQLGNGSDFYTGPTRKIVLNLACDAAEVRLIMACLRKKSVNDLLRAFENVYQVGNYSRPLGPVLDNHVIKEDPRRLIQSGRYKHKRTPILIGIANNEGAFIKDNWLAFAKEGGPRELKQFIDNTIIPNIFEHSAFSHGQDQIRDTLEWRYFEGVPKTVPYYMNALASLVSETHFEVPFFETIELLSTAGGGGGDGAQPNDTNVYVYSYQQSTPIDMRGRVNYFRGASHSSDLPYLLGPSLLQQITRRRFTTNEDKMSKTMRQLVGDFVKTRNPTPGRIFDAWKTYTGERKFIKVLSTAGFDSSYGLESKYDVIERNLEMLEYHLVDKGDKEATQSGNTYSASSYVNDAPNLRYYKDLEEVYSFWRRFLVKIQKNAQLQAISVTGDRMKKEREEAAVYEAGNHKFKHAFFSMLTLVCLLLVILLICLYLLKKNSQTFPREDRGYL